MTKKMKKYFGTKTWFETLYHFQVDEDEVEWRKNFPEFNQNCRDTLAGDTEFYLPEKPFGQFDKNSISNLSTVYHDFEDTNEFITDTEKFYWIKRYRI